MLKKIAWLACVLAALCTLPAQAFKLGEIAVTSKLNQPLAATIPVIDASADDLSALQVELAPPEDYARIGVHRSDYMSTIQLRIKNTAVSTVIVVSSSQINREPFLDLLLETHLAGSKQLREFSLLFDPPGQSSFDEVPPADAPAAAEDAIPAEPTPAPAAAAAPPVPAAVPETAAEPDMPAVPAAPAEPAASTPPAVPPPAPAIDKSAPAHQASLPVPTATKIAAAPAGSAKTYGPVANGETFWSIAKKLRPQQATQEQTLLALYQANPRAFPDGRFNGIVRGAVLTVPSADQILATDPAAASARIAELRQGLTSSPSNAQANGGKSAPLPPPTAAAAHTAKSPAAQTEQTAPAMADTPNTAAVAPAPTPPPAPAAPAPEATATLPAAAGQDQTPAAAEPSAAAAASATGSEPGPPAASSPEPAAASPAAPASNDPAGAQAMAPPVETATANGESFFQRHLLALGLLLLLAFIGWFIWRRQVDEEELPPPFPPPMPQRRMPTSSALSTPAMPPAAAPGSLTTPSTAASGQELHPPRTLGDTSAFVQQTTATQPLAEPEQKAIPVVVPVVVVPAAAPVSSEAAIAESAAPIVPPPTMAPEAADSGADDAAAAAESLLAYGRYDEAAVLLQQALSKNPSRQDLRIKLCETWFGAGKGREFEEAAMALHSHVSTAEWQKIAILGHQLLPGSTLFGEAASAPIAEVDFDLDAGASGSIQAVLTRLDSGSIDGQAFGLIGDPATKLDLARAYADMGDNEAARDLLLEVVAAGDESRREQAEALLLRLA